MKNWSLFFLMVSLVTGMHASDDAGQLAVALAINGTQMLAEHQKHEQSLPNEKNYRRRLYWLDQHNPNWTLLADLQKDFEYHIANLIDHIKVLESKILEKRNYMQSSAMMRGAVLSAFAVLSGYGARYFSTLRKMVKADSTIGESDKAMRSQELMTGYVGLGIMFMACAGGAATQFYKLSRYAERLLERLERDKRILAILEAAKVAKDGATNNVSDAALELVNSLVGVITSFSQPQQTAPVAMVATPIFNSPVSEVVHAVEQIEERVEEQAAVDYATADDEYEIVLFE